MSDDKNNSDPFDFDFDALNEGEPSAQPGDSAFDFDNPFGDDVIITRNAASEVSADNPFPDDSFGNTADGFGGFGEDSFRVENLVEESSEISEGNVPPAISVGETTDKKKKGLLGGLFGGKKEKASKEKVPKEKQAKPKKEKVPKDKESDRAPAMPRDWGTILCITFSVFLLASLLMLNVATFFMGGDIVPTLCFLGAFNIVFLALAAVPILFYKFPQERTLPNILLGISVGAMFTGVLFLVIEFYRYDFLMRP